MFAVTNTQVGQMLFGNVAKLFFFSRGWSIDYLANTEDLIAFTVFSSFFSTVEMQIFT